MTVEQFIEMMRGFMPLGVHDKTAMPEDVVNAYLEPWSGEDGKRAFFRNLRRLNNEYTLAVADELKTLRHKTLVMWGDKDPFQKPAYAPKLAEAIPNADLVWITDTGHWLIEEKPEEIGNHILSFLASRRSLD